MKTRVCADKLEEHQDVIVAEWRVTKGREMLKGEMRE